MKGGINIWQKGVHLNAFVKWIIRPKLLISLIFRILFQRTATLIRCTPFVGIHNSLSVSKIYDLLLQLSKTLIYTFSSLAFIHKNHDRFLAYQSWYQSPFYPRYFNTQKQNSLVALVPWWSHRCVSRVAEPEKMRFKSMVVIAELCGWILSWVLKCQRERNRINMFLYIFRFLISAVSCLIYLVV